MLVTTSASVESAIVRLSEQRSDCQLPHQLHRPAAKSRPRRDRSGMASLCRRAEPQDQHATRALTRSAAISDSWSEILANNFSMRLC
jgi:hypothetical protein